MSSAGSPGGPRLTVVRPRPPAPSRRPGAAVVAVLVYALLFALALWYLRSKWMRGPLSPAPARTAPPAAAARSASDERAWLLGGAGLPAAGRARLDRRLAAERCDCGCELALKDCLAQDRSCVRSPEIARGIAQAQR
jgi:hypothetical protein